MISLEQIQKELQELHSNALRNLDQDKLLSQLNKYAESSGVVLTFYGLLKYAAERYGGNALYENVLLSDKTVSGYADAARHYKEDMPAALVNAGNYMKALSGQIGDVEMCIKQLERMSFPYVIYILFAGSGHEKLVEQYRPAAAEHMRRYPSTLDLVPERYKVDPNRQEGQHADT